MSRRDSLHDAARRTLEKDGWTITDDPLILISEAIYLKHFQKPIFQLAIDRNKINLLVYKPEQEEIVRWITH